jgi:hypothetical protein
MAPVYLAITGFYALGFLLTLGVAGRRLRIEPAASSRPSLWRDLAEGLAYVWDTPASLAAMWLAFLVNLTAFPLTSGLLPYVAKDIYGLDQTGLGTLVASTALGSLLGSVAVSLAGRSIRPGRMMILFALAWYVALLLFVQMPGPAGGRLALLLSGFMQSLSLVPMSVMLLTSAGRAVSRPRHGRAHAGDLWRADRIISRRRADRAHRFPLGRLALLRYRARADIGDRTLLARRSVAARGAGELTLRRAALRNRNLSLS